MTLGAAVPLAGAAPPWLEFFTVGGVNVRTVTMGCVLIGLSAGVLGCFAFLRKRSLLGDALAHAALPGVCVAFLLAGARDPLIILIGAMAACWVGAISIDLIVNYTRCKEESALGMVLSVFFGLGTLLLTHIQQRGGAGQAGLDRFLFGQAAAMQRDDLTVLIACSVVILVVVAIFYKEFKLLAFDRQFARSLNRPMRAMEVLLATLIVAAVAIGLQAVGVVLMAAMLVTPAAAARYWTHHLGVMLLIAGVFGALSGGAGAYVSYMSAGMPTGPWMVVAASALFGLSLFLAPEQGVLSRWIHHRRFRKRTAEENLLRTLYRFAEEGGPSATGYAPADFQRYRAMTAAVVMKTLGRLAGKGLVEELPGGRFRLTEAGAAHAAGITRRHRLWEAYLSEKLAIAPDHVHDDAEAMEHVLTPELEDRLLETLTETEHDPHDRRIPPPEGTESGSRGQDKRREDR